MTLARRRLRGRLEGGYNMIEVMMGLAVLAVGATGVIALQKVTILGVTGGRNITTATAVASRHLEAVRADGVRWTDINIGAAPLVAALVAAGVWVDPAVNVPFLGDDLGASDVVGTTQSGLVGPVAYCTHLRAVQVSPDPAQLPVLLRIEARTFWAKSGRSVGTECGDGASGTKMDLVLSGAPQSFGAVPNLYSADDYGWVFLATSLRRNDRGAP